MRVTVAYEMIELPHQGGKVGVVAEPVPERLNALNNQLMDELGAALKALTPIRPSAACRHREKAFAAGADIGAMATSFADVYRATSSHCNWETIRSVRKPGDRRSQRLCAGRRLRLAMMCDFIIAADNARFGQPEIKLGIIPRRRRQRASARGGQGQTMDWPHRPHDGRHRGRAGRAGQPRGAAGQAHGRSSGRCADDQRLLADRGDGGEGIGQPGVRGRV